MNEEVKGKKSPQLRFSGFEDDWEEKKLGECFKERTQRSAIGELISVTISSGVKKASELERHDSSSEDKSNYKRVYKGDIAYNSMRMWQGASGVSNYDGILSPAYTVCIPDDNTDSVFFSYMFKIPKIVHTFEINSQGLTKDTWNLKFPAFSLISINATTFAEQQKIGAFLTHIDSLIQAKTKKLESLKAVKKSLLQKCFPKAGEKVPEIRFAGFSGDWEEKKLGEIAEIGDIDHRMPDTVEDGIPYLMTGDFSGINELNFDGVKHISQEDYELLSRKIKPEFEDILFARYATVGAVRYVDVKKDFLISYSCAIIKKPKNVNSKYLYYFLTSELAQTQIQLEIKTGSQANIGIDSMKNNICVLLPPTLAEQDKIANFFSKYVFLISVQKKEIDKLKDIKKSLLQKMFV